MKVIQLIFYAFILLIIFMIADGCTSESIMEEVEPPLIEDHDYNFPPYITPINSYFEYSIGKAPIISKDQYRLKIHGLIENPMSFTLSELMSLKMYDKLQTIECIGNPVNGNMIGTANWKGFNIYDLLDTLGIKENAKSVNYICADGFFSSNTLEELRSNNIIGAMYINQEILPVGLGFPLRVLNSGYFGVKNPSWITEIEVVEEIDRHYWTGSLWEYNEAMEVDSKIFFPEYSSNWFTGDTVWIGGAAFGGDEITKVEYTVDDGVTWQKAKIIRENEDKNVWVFWEVKLVFENKGTYVFKSRATDNWGNSQPNIDNNKYNGRNSSPQIQLIIN